MHNAYIWFEKQDMNKVKLCTISCTTLTMVLSQQISILNFTDKREKIVVLKVLN